MGVHWFCRGIGWIVSPGFQMHLFTMNQDRDGHAPEICSRTSAILCPRVYVPVGMSVFNDRMYSCKGKWGGFACGASWCKASDMLTGSPCWSGNLLLPAFLWIENPASAEKEDGRSEVFIFRLRLLDQASRTQGSSGSTGSRKVEGAEGIRMSIREHVAANSLRCPRKTRIYQATRHPRL